MQFGNNKKDLDVLQQFGINKKDLNVLQQSGEGNQILDATRYFKFQIFQQLNSTRRELNFHIIQQLNCIMRELNFNITFKDGAKRGERKLNLDPMWDLIFTMYRWVLPKQKLLFLQQANGINLDDYQANKFQQIVQALKIISLNFTKFDIAKTCALCGNPGYTFNNCSEVTNPILQ